MISYLRISFFRFNYGLYADLFNSCATSPEPDFALTKALELRESLFRKARGDPPQVRNSYYISSTEWFKCNDPPYDKVLLHDLTFKD